jgi:hypothetical protein
LVNKSSCEYGEVVDVSRYILLTKVVVIGWDSGCEYVYMSWQKLVNFLGDMSFTDKVYSDWLVMMINGNY